MFNPFVAIVPAACVTLGGLAAMLAEAFREPDERLPIGGLAVVSLVAAGISSMLLWGRHAASFGVVSADDFALFVTLVLVLVGILTVLFSSAVLERDKIPSGEYHALVLFAIGGMMLMASAVDLLIIFLALEILSLALYVLTGIRRGVARSTEAAFKYFLLGAFSSAFFLYGIAFTYGIVGSTRLESISVVMSGQGAGANPMAQLALGLLIVGFAFKVSAVPFHMWTPDAYEGAPAVVAGFMSTGVKAAAFAAFARVFLSAFGSLSADWAPVVWGLAILTMVAGTVAAVAQTNIKRLLAYSSIAHAGYLLVALVAGNEIGKGAILFYLLVYAVTNIAAFGIVALLGAGDRIGDDLADYAGLSSRQPLLAGLMTVFLLSLGGFPPTAGFVAKWYVFSAAVSAGYTGLAIVGVLTSVVSVFFYLRIVVAMYMVERPPAASPASVLQPLTVCALVASVVIILYLGILPARLLDLAASSVGTIF
jgi:NADH-quinone oxidoreductase subunit N